MIKQARFHIGLRTAKTVAAVILSMITVDAYGLTSSKLIFAMLGAMAAVQPTFQDSVSSCLTQIVGVLFGALIGIVLLAIHLPSLPAVAIGMILVITLYNVFSLKYSPSLPCFIVVLICTTEDIQPLTYAVERIWDTAIGLGIGMLINTLVFPYDNSRKIRATVESLDKDVIRFLEEMFDGDANLPVADAMSAKIDELSKQLTIFQSQKLPLHLRKQRTELETFRRCQGQARVLLARLEVLSRLDEPGNLTKENKETLEACGAVIKAQVLNDPLKELDIVVNFHVRQILTIRQELMDLLK